MDRTSTDYDPAKTKKMSRGGFAAMSPEKRRAIAAKGGKVTWKTGKAHRWSREEAHRAAHLPRKQYRRRRKGEME